MIFLIFVAILIAPSSCELEMVIELFRTGARNNVYQFNRWAQNEDPEEITEVGLHQQYILGQQMRKKYVEENKFLSPTFKEEEFLILSTDFNRTIMSAYSQMLGFYPEKNNVSQNYDFVPNLLSFEENPEIEELFKEAFIPFPIHALRERNDFILRALKCKVFKFLVSENKENNEILEGIADNFHETFQKVGKIMGIEKFNLDKLFKIMDGFSSDIFANKNLPSELDSSLWPRLRFLYSIYWPASYFHTELNQRFSNTLIFEFIQSYFDKKFKGLPAPKFILLGGHDITLIHTMIGLNLTSADCQNSLFYNKSVKVENCETLYPSFASNLLLELHKPSDFRYLKIELNL